MQKVISIALSILMLLSSTGITYAKHFCGENEVISEITFGEKHLSCGMAMEANSCGDEKQEDHKCCKNKYEQVNTDDHFAKASFDVQLDVPFITSFVAVFVLQQMPFNSQVQTNYTDYHPPIPDKDFTVLYQVFTI